MDIKEIIAKVHEKKGQFANIEYNKVCKVKKNAPEFI